MSSPLATIVIPAYNAESTLRATLESALAQDYDQVEIVVVDDGSTDSTGEIPAEFAAVRCVRQENAGPSAARNRGLEEARGMFVAFLDADDLAPPDKLSVQVGFLLEHPDVDCVLGRQEVDVEGGGAPAWIGRDRVHGDFAGVPLMSLVARRETLRTLGGFDESLRIAEDRDLLVRMRERGLKIEFLPEVVLMRRFHGHNLSFERGEEHPVFRSLKAKLDRARSDGS
jgi:glycosyltransferase involved in cell wall biosynthesis